MKKYLGWIIAGAILFTGITSFLVWNGTRQEAINQEFALSAQFPNNQNILSTLVVGAKEQIGIADRGTEQLDRFMENALKGRYDDDGISMGNGSLVNALSEAYPEGKSIPGLYEKVMDYLQAGRAEYKGAQTKLLDMTRVYKSYIGSSAIRSFILSIGGNYPSDNLVAKIGDREYKGKEALAKMEDIVVAQEAIEAYESGVMAPVTVPELPPRQ